MQLAGPGRCAPAAEALIALTNLKWFTDGNSDTRAKLFASTWSHYILTLTRIPVDRLNRVRPFCVPPRPALGIPGHWQAGRRRRAHSWPALPWRSRGACRAGRRPGSRHPQPAAIRPGLCFGRKNLHKIFTKEAHPIPYGSGSESQGSHWVFFWPCGRPSGGPAPGDVLRPNWVRARGEVVGRRFAAALLPRLFGKNPKYIKGCLTTRAGLS